MSFLECGKLCYENPMIDLTPDKDLQERISFINEVDKLKNVLRMNLLSDGSRRENTAEHSWHFSLMVWVLEPYARSGSIDLLKTMKMAIIHDLVEIDAGDTYAYDEKGYEDKEERETLAAKRIFGLLPDPAALEIHELWSEFEEGKTEEARFARAIDRLNPFMQNYLNDGHPWKDNHVTSAQAYGRMGEIEENCPALWPFVRELIESSVARGWIQK